ncbi:BTAD domain-containing putative transcriptional regulator [Actinocrispum sp. NPDC049592]|uniref:AfsR/SARP family transcriptional regulator n=1 Tax=Actinocrispum sp. NPDC049592 TaxID=3154835 RepID=UPI0034138AF4
MTVRFGVLGPLTVVGPTGELRLRGDHQRALLAMLVFHANRPVTTDLLVGALWPELPPKSYASNLHTYVSRLRARLRGVEIDHSGRGYRLHVPTEDVDLLVFREQAAAGRSAARAGQHEKAAGHLRHALTQWRGHPLGDMHVPVLDAEITRLESERLAVFEDCADAELAAGRHAELAAELQAALIEHPLRERLAGQLMVALQHSGRQAEALEVYRRTRATLIDELGVEPGAALRRLHESLLRGETDTPLPKPTWPICQLPATSADFSGREQYLAEITGLLNPGGHSVPVVVLSGEPGAGKTTLSITAAHQLRSVYPDAQLFVSLSGVDSPRDIGAVLADLLRGLGVSGPAIPDDLQARAAAYRGLLTDRKVLVVLDDAAEPSQVRPLLPGTPGCAVLITSRRRLSGLDGASRVGIGPFSDSEALRVLERIAGRQRVAAEQRDAERIAAACGNLPLALRIAGTRLALRPNLPLAVLAARLEDEGRRLDELAVSDLAVRASLTMSYASLSESARIALRRLGNIDTVDIPEWRVVTLLGAREADDAMEDLVESGLVEPIGIDETGEPRYRMHSLVRVFAMECTRAEDDWDARMAQAQTIIDAMRGIADVAARKLPWTLPLPRLGELDRPQPLPPDLVKRLTADPHAWFATERTNLLTGMSKVAAHGWEREAMQLMDRLAVYLWLHGQYADMRLGYQSLAESTDERVAAQARSALALLRHARGQYERAIEEYRASAKELDALGEHEALGWVQHNLASCLIAVRQPEESIELAEAARTHLSNDPYALGMVLHTLATALNRLGRTEESARIEDEALTLARKSGESRQLAIALHDRAWGFVLANSTSNRTEPAPTDHMGHTGVERPDLAHVRESVAEGQPTADADKRSSLTQSQESAAEDRLVTGTPDSRVDNRTTVTRESATEDRPLASTPESGADKQNSLTQTQELAPEDRPVANASESGADDRAALVRARELAEEAIALLRKENSRSALAKALRTLGAICAGIDDREASMAAFREARDIARELSELPRELSCTRAIAAGWIGEGKAVEAIPVLRDCLRTYREMGSTSATAITLHLLAAAYESTGKARDAGFAREEAERLGDPRDSNTSTLLRLLLSLTRPG